MPVVHLLAPGGLRTCCDEPTDKLAPGHTADHELGRPGLCGRCRARLLARPQLLAAVVAELRADGLPVPELATLRLEPKPMSPAQLRAIRRRMAEQRAKRTVNEPSRTESRR